MPIGLKHKVVRVMRQPSVGRFLGNVFGERIPTRGCIIDTSDARVVPEVKADLFFRFYESCEIRFVARYLRRDLDVVELGGSIGVVTCQIRKLIGSNCRMVCVEADSELVRLIGNNLKINRLDKQVSVVNAAIDYSGGETVCFAAGPSNSEGKVDQQDSRGCGLEVKTTTLSRVLSEYGLADYALVCDIEGAEAGIIFRDRDAFLNCKQIIIELHDTVFEGERVGTGKMLNVLTRTHGFHLRDSYGPVCVLERW